MILLRKDIKEGYLHNHKDIGIDIVQIENDKCSIVQCKNGYNNGLCVDDILIPYVIIDTNSLLFIIIFLLR